VGLVPKEKVKYVRVWPMGGLCRRTIGLVT